jgi:hypothetical protein
MLQRQVEVAGALRSPPKTNDELLRTRLVIKGLSAFLTQLNRLATKLQLPLEAVFQCLMQIGLGHMDGVDFDKQHRSGNVPMHQAKVLDRNATLNAQRVEPKVREVLDEETLNSHVARCGELRTHLRMKVEDGNDLSMARKLVVLSEEYLDCIFTLAQGDGAMMMKLYLADDPQTIHAITGGSHSLSAASAGVSPSRAHGGKPLPSNMIKGLTEECRGVLEDLKVDFPRRQKSLAVIKDWLQCIDPDSLERHFVGIISALQEPLRAQLGDKRSAICRLACDLVSILLLRVRNTSEIMHIAKTREVLAIWVDVLLKGVHVTVAAIAEATDLTMRDVVVTTRSCGSFLLHLLCQALAKAAQPELKRKLLNYLFLLVAGDPQVTRLGPHELAPVLPLVVKLCNSSEEACRRVARMVLIRAEDLGCLITSPLDPKLERAVAAERGGVLDACAGSSDALEVVLLKYAIPSRASSGGWVIAEDALGSTSATSRQASEILSSTSASHGDEDVDGLTSTATSSISKQTAAPPRNCPPTSLHAAHPPTHASTGNHSLRSPQKQSRSAESSSERQDPPSTASGSEAQPKAVGSRSNTRSALDYGVPPAVVASSQSRGNPRPVAESSSLPEISVRTGPMPQLSTADFAHARTTQGGSSLAVLPKRTSPPLSDSPLVSCLPVSQHLSAVPLSLRGLSASSSVNTAVELGHSQSSGSNASLTASLKKRLSQRSMNETPTLQQ